jgi:hypothetical protein
MGDLGGCRTCRPKRSLHLLGRLSNDDEQRLRLGILDRRERR